MANYEKWAKDNTELLNTITDPDALKLAKMDGYLLVVEPSLLPTKKKGSLTFTETERSWKVIDKTQEEKDADAALLVAAAEAEADEILIVESVTSVGLLKWVGSTDAQIDTKIDNKFSDPGEAVVVKEICYALRDLANIADRLKKRGRL